MQKKRPNLFTNAVGLPVTCDSYQMNKTKQFLIKINLLILFPSKTEKKSSLIKRFVETEYINEWFVYYIAH